MNQLLFANFARLKKEKVFWLGVILMFLFGAYLPIDNYFILTKNGYQTSAEDVFFTFIVVIGIFCAAFCSLYLGTEYSDGTIRNKIIIGHSRSSIYLANFIVSFAAGLFVMLAYLLSASAFGISLLGFFTSDIAVIASHMLLSILVILAFTSIFTLLSMLIQNKAVVAIISVIGFFVCFFVSSYINSRLGQPEIWVMDGYYYDNEQGELVKREEVRNENYLRGEKRAAYEFFFDFLPTGQALQIVKKDAQNIWQMSLYSVLIVVVSTGSGLFFFRRKNLK